MSEGLEKEATWWKNTSPHRPHCQSRGKTEGGVMEGRREGGMKEGSREIKGRGCYT